MRSPSGLLIKKTYTFPIVSSICWLCVDCVLTVCWLYVDCVLTVCWLYVDLMLGSLRWLGASKRIASSVTNHSTVSHEAWYNSQNSETTEMPAKLYRAKKRQRCQINITNLKSVKDAQGCQTNGVCKPMRSWCCKCPTHHKEAQLRLDFRTHKLNSNL